MGRRFVGHMARTISKKIPRKSDHELARLLPFPCHGASSLPLVDVDSYNVELKERRRYVGDRANKKAFERVVAKWRKIVGANGGDPFEESSAKPLSRKKLEKALLHGKPEAAAIVQAAIDEFAGRLVEVIERYREIPDWKNVERIVVGGGLRGSRLGELVIGRVQTLLYEKGIRIDVRPIRAEPDEAGLMGAAFLAPHWIFSGYDGVLAADIGGTNLRVGALKLHRARNGRLKQVSVARLLKWEHGEEEVSREEFVDQLLKRLSKLVRWSRSKSLRLAPFVGVGCPGRVRPDGAIDRGTQNLPGNWESEHFNLPAHLTEHLQIIRGQRTVVIMHNDAVTQGLSEMIGGSHPKDWAILTIGTGLGNAKFTRTALDRDV